MAKKKTKNYRSGWRSAGALAAWARSGAGSHGDKRKEQQRKACRGHKATHE
jgi:hypothetical protein